MDSRTPLLVVLPSLGGGGAERAAVDLLHGLRESYRLQVALFQRRGPLLDQLPEEIQCLDLQGGNQNDIRLVPRLARILRRERPAIVLSVLRYANLITILARDFSRSPVKVVINEQNLPSAEFKALGGGTFKSLMLRHLYPRADLVTAISAGIRDELTDDYHVSPERTRVIPNPIDLERVRRLSQVPLDHPWFNSPIPVIVAIGRLHPQKDLPTLLCAVARVRLSHPCRLIVLGEGPQRLELEQLVQDLDLSDAVLLPGFQANPYNYLARATLFTLSSIYEGFGNVLVEALALGVPIVATDCPVGPREIVDHERTALLTPVGDAEALASAIVRLLNDAKLRGRLARAGPIRAADFALPRVVSAYDQALKQVIRCAS